MRQRTLAFREAAEAIVDEVRELGRCDLVADVAGKMASYVTADILDIPREDAVRLYEYVEIGLGGGGAFTPEERQAATGSLIEYSVGVWQDRKANPGDDVCSQLAACTIDGEPMGLEDFCANLVLLIVGGGDTTRHLIAGGMHALRTPSRGRCSNLTRIGTSVRPSRRCSDGSRRRCTTVATPRSTSSSEIGPFGLVTRCASTTPPGIGIRNSSIPR